MTAIVYELRWPTGEVYVGSTGRSLDVRLQDHKRHPHKCYEDLGLENAKAVEVLRYEPKHRCDREPERLYKQKLTSAGVVVLDDGDHHAAPLWMTQEEKLKISKGNTGKVRTQQMRASYSRSKSGAKNPAAVAFTCTLPCGSIKEFETIKSAASHFGVSNTTISRHLRRGLVVQSKRKESSSLNGCRFEYVK